MRFPEHIISAIGAAIFAITSIFTGQKSPDLSASVLQALDTPVNSVVYPTPVVITQYLQGPKGDKGDSAAGISAPSGFHIGYVNPIAADPETGTQAGFTFLGSQKFSTSELVANSANLGATTISSLTISGAVAFPSISACTGSGDKLLYDSITGSFLCGSDLGGGASASFSYLSITGMTSDATRNALSIVNASSSPLLTIRNDGVGAFGADPSLNAVFAVKSATFTGAENVTTAGSSTTVTTTGNAFANITNGATLLANGEAAQVISKVDDNTVITRTAVDWSAGYPFTYTNASFLAADSNANVSAGLRILREGNPVWNINSVGAESDQFFYLFNNATRANILRISERGNIGLNIPYNSGDTLIEPPANLSIYPQAFNVVYAYVGGTYYDSTTKAETSEDDPTPFMISPNADFLYVGMNRTFNSVFLERSSGPTLSVMKAEYWNGSGWVMIGPSMEFMDDTEGFTRSGAISWDRSLLTGWEKTAINGSSPYYFARMSFTTYIGGPLRINMIVPGSESRLSIFKAPFDTNPAMEVNGLGHIGMGDALRQTRLEDESHAGLDPAALSIVDRNGSMRLWSFDSNRPAAIDLIAGTASIADDMHWSMELASASSEVNYETLFIKRHASTEHTIPLSLGYTNVADASRTGAVLANTFGAMNGNDLMRGLFLDYTNGTYTGSNNTVRALDIASIIPSANASESAIFIGSGWDYAFVASQGNAGFGTTTPETRLEVIGIASASQLFGAGLVECTGSNKILWSNGIFSCATAVGGLDPAGNEVITGSWQFANNVSISSGYPLEITGYASASKLFGAGLAECSGSGAKLLWNAATGQFSCGTDAGAGGGLTIDVAETGSAGADVSSASFNAAHFGVTFSAPEAVVSLDWGSGGPASLSQNEIVTGAWQLTGGVSISLNPFEVGPNTLYVRPGAGVGINTDSIAEAFELVGNASISGNITALGHGVFGSGSHTQQTLLQFNVGHAISMLYTPNQFGNATYDGLVLRQVNTEQSLFTVYGSQSVQYIANAQGAGYDAQFIAMNNPNMATLTNAAQGLFTNKATTHDIAIQYRYGTDTPVDAIMLDVNPTANIINSIIVNDAGQNIPFRVAGLTDADLITTDGSSKVGVGVAVPETKLEVVGAASASQLFGAGLTDCDGDSERLNWTASGSNAGKFSCKSGAVVATYMGGNQDLGAGTINVMNIFTTTGNTGFAINTAGNEEVRMNTAGYITSCMIVLNANVTAGTATMVARKNGATVGGNSAQYCRLTTTVNRTNAEAIPNGAISFVAGDTIGAAVSTSAAFTPTNVDAMVYFTVTFPTGADVAETYFTDDELLGNGMAVSLGDGMFAGVRRSASAYDAQAIGIISTAPGLVVGDSVGPGRKVYVALAGRVPAWVSTENGVVETGDYLTTSATTPGVLMKATQPGWVLGQAMVEYSGEGIGQTILFVKNAWYNGEETQAFAPESSFVSGVINSLKDAALSIKDLIADIVTAKKIQTDMLCVGSTCVMESQLQELLQRSRVNAATPAPTPSESAMPLPSDTPSPSATSVVPSDTPEPSNTPLAPDAPIISETLTPTPTPVVDLPAVSPSITPIQDLEKTPATTPATSQ